MVGKKLSDHKRESTVKAIKIEYKIKGITLNVHDLVEINNYYRIATIAEYLLDNYSKIKNEEEAMKIAYKVNRTMDRYQLSEEDAVAEIMMKERKQ